MQPEPGQQSAEASLVLAAQRGDMEAFEALYRQYFGAVYDFAVRTMKDSHSAADAVQDSFIKAHERIGQLRDPEAFRPWLYSIVRREALGSFRSQAKETFVPAIEEDGAGLNPLLSQVDDDLAGDPAAAAELSDSASLVWEAAASLDADTYTVLDLHVRQGLGSAEIAEVLGITKGNAYTKLNRMKERMGTSISTYLLIRKGSKDCQDLSQMVAGVELPPVSEQLRKRVDRHAKSCDECSERRKALVAPMSIFAALAAVPPPAGLQQTIWTNISDSDSASFGDPRVRRRGLWALTLVGVFVAVLGIVSVLGAGSISGDVVPEAESALAAPGSTTAAVNGVAHVPTTISLNAGSAGVGLDIDPGLVPVLSPAVPPETTTTTTTPRETTPPADEAPSETTATTEAPPPAAEPPPAAAPPPEETTTTATTPPATTPTLPEPPPDTTPPSIAQAAASPGQIWELDSNVISCPPENSRLSKITASVSDTESGISTVKASWAIGGSTSTTSMTLVGSNYTADFGPFQAGTFADNTTVSITIAAEDVEGNLTNAGVTVNVMYVGDCFG